ncbi:ABC transporter permease [Roseateles toxinivorans]|uniref:Phospholipid/cholesterol/gamma-HCH transport system permease protein n=1 Tax=Roseateles toxinivorans TaxID=270368 RepID=A0A4R6QLG4_9BURK|nr:ABC transporter permease [Roseateles toxinivorans]TDP64207.1 phospholipid/cholesterol/gamma-HCH transport system permease protein [Roseateles toxinivorans]
MPQPSRAPAQPLLHTLRQWLTGWWGLLLFGARLAVLALSPSSWRRSQRRLMLHQAYAATMPLLLGFGLGSAIMAQVIIRIVLATAQSYGLTGYALNVLVRTLVLELIPLSAALYTAVRYTMPAAEQVRAMRARGLHKAQLAQGLDPLRDTVLPRALAGVFAAITLTLLAATITLLLTYLNLYGFSTWGLTGFVRGVGQVFGPVIVLIFALKALLLSLAVAVIPMRPGARDGAPGADLNHLARLLAVVLLIELLSLVGNYY